MYLGVCGRNHISPSRISFFFLLLQKDQTDRGPILLISQSGLFSQFFHIKDIIAFFFYACYYTSGPYHPRHLFPLPMSSIYASRINTDPFACRVIRQAHSNS